MWADSNCSYVEQYSPNHTYTFKGVCKITREPYSVEVKADELYAYRQGAYAQDAFRSLDAGQREFLISGISPKGWDKLFAE